MHLYPGNHIIGVPKEIKDLEGRVGLRPQDVSRILKNKSLNIQILVESNAGLKSGYHDADYVYAGAKITDTVTVYEKSSLIIKVKEPIAHEIKYLSDIHKTFFCYFHFATSKLDSGTCATMYPYEELTHNDRQPLLFPMSEIAGKLSAQKGAELLSNNGILIGGATGVDAANVLVLGGGTVGYNAAKIAIGMGANVTVLDRDLNRIRELNELIPRSRNLYIYNSSLTSEVEKADLIIGSVHSVGKETDKLINEDHFDVMKIGSVFVDVSIDQGGCTTASFPTTHSNPTYVHNKTTMYCVTNMPGLTPKTSTNALCNATAIYIDELLNTDSLDKYYK